MIVVASLLAGCSPDDPIITEPAAVFSPEMNVQEIVPTTTTSTPQEPVQITIFQPVPQAVYTVMDEYSWMEQSVRVADLQKVLGIEADGIYGPGTRSAHVTFLDGQVHLTESPRFLDARPTALPHLLTAASFGRTLSAGA